MAKLSYQDKIKIYNRWKQGESSMSLSKTFNIHVSGIKYLIKLIDIYGIDICKKNKNRYYSPSLKIKIINKILVEHKSLHSIALSYGLSSCGMISNWIKSYKENNYVIVEKKRGRKSTVANKNINNTNKDESLEEKNKELKKRLLYLEAENEYLKKLAAVVQKKQKQQMKKKK